MADVTVPGELRAPERWRRVDFVSDLHLAADTPAAFQAWQAYMQGTAADAVFLLGDLFEAWVGDDSRHDGFEAGCARVLSQSAASRDIYFMAGNRDFLVGQDLLEACGVTGLDDPTVVSAFGERALLTHGDAWCIADTAYQQFRRQVRHPAWQAQVLAKPLAERRALARTMRSESERQAGDMTGEWADVDRPTALAVLEQAGAAVLVHGHTHRPGTDALAPGMVRHVLSDWHLEGETPRAEILRWTATGWTRLGPQDAARREP